MRFLSVTVRNFLSWGDTPQTIDLDQRGLVLIEGINADDPSATSNGSGKSSIPEALLWGCFGITTHGYEGDDVCRWIFEANPATGERLRVRQAEICVVFVDFEADDGTRYQIQRYRRMPATPHQGLDLRQAPTWIKLTEKDPRETQAKINRLLGFTPEVFRYTILFNKDDVAFPALSDREQAEIFDEALGLERYTLAGSIAKSKAESLDLDTVTVQRRISDREADLLAAQERLRLAQEAHRDYSTEKRKLLALMRADFDAAKQEHEEAKILASLVPGLRKAEAVAEHAWQEQDAKYRQLAAEQAVAQATAKRRLKEAEDLETEIHTKETGLKPGETCSECGSEIDEHTRDAHIQRIKDHSVEVWEDGDRHERLAKTLTEKAKWAAAERERLRLALEAVRTELREAEAALVSTPSLMRRRTDLLKRYNETGSAPSPHQKLIREASQDIIDAQRWLGLEQDDLASFLAEAKKYRFWVAGMRELRRLIVENALPFLNEKAAEYSDALTAGTIRIEFRAQTTLKKGTVKDHFNIYADNGHGAALYKGNSRGERGKIDLITSLAFHALVSERAHSRPNVAFFDEPFDGLDETGIARLAAFLTSTLTKRESVFVITHREELKALLSTVITVEKRDDETRLL